MKKKEDEIDKQDSEIKNLAKVVKEDHKKVKEMEDKEFQAKGVITVAQKDAIVVKAIANAKAQML